MSESNRAQLILLAGRLRPTDYVQYLSDFCRRYVSAAIDRDYKKIFYLFKQLTSWRANVRERIAINTLRRRAKYVILRQYPVKTLKFSHDVGFSDDEYLNERIFRLSSYSPEDMSMEVLARECPSDAPIQTMDGFILNGNGRVYALKASGHGDFLLLTYELDY